MPHGMSEANPARGGARSASRRRWSPHFGSRSLPPTAAMPRRITTMAAGRRLIGYHRAHAAKRGTERVQARLVRARIVKNGIRRSPGPWLTTRVADDLRRCLEGEHRQHVRAHPSRRLASGYADAAAQLPLSVEGIPAGNGRGPPAGAPGRRPHKRTDELRVAPLGTTSKPRRVRRSLPHTALRNLTPDSTERERK